MGKELSAFSGQVEDQSELLRRVARARSYSRPTISPQMLAAAHSPEARYARSVAAKAQWESPEGVRTGLILRVSLSVNRYKPKGIPLSDEHREKLRSYMLRGGSKAAARGRYGEGVQARNEQMARDFWLQKEPAESLAARHGIKVATVLKIVATTALKP